MVYLCLDLLQLLFEFDSSAALAYALTTKQQSVLASLVLPSIEHMIADPERFYSKFQPMLTAYNWRRHVSWSPMFINEENEIASTFSGKLFSYYLTMNLFFRDKSYESEEDRKTGDHKWLVECELTQLHPVERTLILPVSKSWGLPLSVDHGPVENLRPAMIKIHSWAESTVQQMEHNLLARTSNRKRGHRASHCSRVKRTKTE